MPNSSISPNGFLANDSLYISSFQISSSQISPGQISLNQISSRQIGIDQASVSQISSSKISESQIGPSQIAISEIRFGQTGTSQSSLPQVGSEQIDFFQILLAQIGITQIDPAQITARKLSPIKLDTGETSFPSSITLQQFLSSHNFNLQNTTIPTWTEFLTGTTPFNLKIEITDRPTGQLAEANITHFDPTGRPTSGTLTLDTDARGPYQVNSTNCSPNGTIGPPTTYLSSDNHDR